MGNGYFQHITKQTGAKTMRLSRLKNDLGTTAMFWENCLLLLFRIGDSHLFSRADPVAEKARCAAEKFFRSIGHAETVFRSFSSGVCEDISAVYEFFNILCSGRCTGYDFDFSRKETVKFLSEQRIVGTAEQKSLRHIGKIFSEIYIKNAAEDVPAFDPLFGERNKQWAGDAFDIGVRRDPFDFLPVCSA